MRNKKFDKERLPMTFYAHTLQFLERDAADGRCAVSFEAVQKAEVQMFVTGERPKKFSNTAEQVENFSTLWENFQKGGLASPAFVDNKAGYLGKVGNAQIALLFHSFAKAKSIAQAKQDWWEITIKDNIAPREADACIFKITGNEQTKEAFAFTIRPISKEEEDRLYHLYTQFTKSESKKPKNSEKSIGPNTSYQSVEVCYVGAALCCQLIERTGRLITRTAGYFDMGQECIFSEAVLILNDPNAQIMINEKTRIYREVVNRVRTTGNLGIIISHWHTDHTDILNDLAVGYVQNGYYANFWQTAQFFIPGVIQATGWAVTHYTNFQAAVQQAGNPNITEEPYHSANQFVNLYQSPGMQINKCDRNDAHRVNIDHHDHGIWAVVTLNNGNTVFLAGDCAYDTIGVRNPNAGELTNQGNGFEYLVASHHGGKYTHTNAQNKAQYIPTPSLPQQSEAFYSANGIAYGHPNPTNVADYTANGWNPRYTHTLPAQGNNRWNVS